MAGSGSSALCRRLGGWSFAFLNGLFEDVLDLAVHAAEFSLRPSLKLSPERRVHPEQETLALGHANLDVERAGVDDRVNLGFTAEHDHQVADHRRLAVVIKG